MAAAGKSIAAKNLAEDPNERTEGGLQSVEKNGPEKSNLRGKKTMRQSDEGQAGRRV